MLWFIKMMSFRKSPSLRIASYNLGPFRFQLSLVLHRKSFLIFTQSWILTTQKWEQDTTINIQLAIKFQELQVHLLMEFNYKYCQILQQIGSHSSMICIQLSIEIKLRSVEIKKRLKCERMRMNLCYLNYSKKILKYQELLKLFSQSIIES